MMSDIDIFLTEAMGECWHEWEMPDRFTAQCIKCDMTIGMNINMPVNLDFSTWRGFGILWEWAKTQKWWKGFIYNKYRSTSLTFDIIDPVIFANAVYDYLLEKKYGT